MDAYRELLEKAYGLYKKDWCDARGYDPDLVADADSHDEEYNGEMYAGMGEFEDCEFTDEDYMRSLLGEEYDDSIRKIKMEQSYSLLIGHSVKGSEHLRSVQEVAGFICQHGQYGDLTVTQEDGTPFLNTFGIYIDRIADMDYREVLLKTLIPMQMELDGTNAIDELDGDMEGQSAQQMGGM